jgi:hypothetical protein
MALFARFRNAMRPPRLARQMMQLCCVFLLLFAQQSALTHAMWHAFGASANYAQKAGAASQPAPQPGDAALCAFDAAYGQALGAALGGAPSDVPAPLAQAAALHSKYSFTTPQFLAPLSRGPPALS